MTKGVVLEEQGVSVYLLLDRSGSMQTLWGEAIGSINTYITGLKEGQTEKDRITIATFDDSGFEVPVDYLELSKLKEIRRDIASPRGMTPLFDAAGKIINKALEKNDEKSVIVIMTDGGENCSKEFKKDSIQKLIKEAEGKGWEVIFLGANFDNSQDAISLGLADGKFMAVASGSMTQSFADLSGRTRAYASVGQAINYSAEDKNAAWNSGTK